MNINKEKYKKRFFKGYKNESNSIKDIINNNKYLYNIF